MKQVIVVCASTFWAPSHHAPVRRKRTAAAELLQVQLACRFSVSPSVAYVPTSDQRGFDWIRARPRSMHGEKRSQAGAPRSIPAALAWPGMAPRGWMLFRRGVRPPVARRDMQAPPRHGYGAQRNCWHERGCQCAAWPRRYFIFLSE